MRLSAGLFVLLLAVSGAAQCLFFEKIPHIRRQVAGPVKVRAVPIQGNSDGVEGMAGEEKTFGERRRPSGADEFQVAIGRGAVDFVADDRMSVVGKVDPDLVGAAGEGFRGDKGEGTSVVQVS